ncbi:MAG: nicotinate (nicotinamide) nucleotide adenylyltransferase [Rhodoferax sp.]|nr:nicotinate (nicotinamide) nucleotide adenylyltransferase [Rhodoferax sp.]
MTKPGLRIGLFGGSFDPPHAAHVALVKAAVSQLALDELRVLPTGHAWHKSRTLSAAEHRLAMAELAFAGVERVRVDPREILRAGPSYTVDTLREIRLEQPGAELFLVIGEDQARSLTTWHDWEEIPKLAIICVAARAYSMRAEDQFNGQFSAPQAYQSRFCTLQMPLLSVSATDIRSRIASRQGVVPLVGEAVARYIDQHHLYQTA